MFAIVAYHWNPSFQSSVPFELIALLGFEDEFVVESGPRDAGIGIKVDRVLRQASLDTFWWELRISHDRYGCLGIGGLQ